MSAERGASPGRLVSVAPAPRDLPLPRPLARPVISLLLSPLVAVYILGNVGKLCTLILQVKKHLDWEQATLFRRPPTRLPETGEELETKKQPSVFLTLYTRCAT